MTHAQWEKGCRLTAANATKAQLIFMVRDLERRIEELNAEKALIQEAFNELLQMKMK